jgi:hypothetical protein
MSLYDKIKKAISPEKIIVAPPALTIADIKAAHQLVQSSTRLMENALERNKKANSVLIQLVERSDAA